MFMKFLFYLIFLSFFLKNYSYILMLLTFEILSILNIMNMFYFNNNLIIMLLFLLFLIMESILSLFLMILILRMFSSDNSISMKF